MIAHEYVCCMIYLGQLLMVNFSLIISEDEFSWMIDHGRFIIDAFSWMTSEG